MEAAAQAYLAGLKMLAQRELSEAQVRTRLSRREYDENSIDDAVARLREERALDDRRVALACARTEARVRQRGRMRIVRHIEALGIAREVARSAVAEVFAEIDESALLERAFEKRVRRGISLDDEADVRRVHRFLIAQGFDASQVTALVKSKIKNQESQID